jgi:transcriptional regulator with XRE-family HTH domain
MDMGKKIKSLREEKGLTQEELAKEISIARSTLACYETSRNSLSAEWIKAFSKFFGVTADYLLGLEDEFGNKN